MCQRRKILVVINTAFVKYGGLATVMLNYYRAMNKSDIQIDFASTNEISEELSAELEENQSKYYFLGKRKKIFNYAINLFKALKSDKYDVIHVNGNSSTMVLELGVAKLCKCKVRIAHVHTTRSKYPVLNKILSPLFNSLCTVKIATSVDAGKWLYKKDYIVLNNAINLDKYRFNKDIRNQYRQKLELNEEDFVIGTVGKLNLQKNQKFLLEIFKEYQLRNTYAKLIIVGGGELEDKLKAYAKALDISNRVLFLGMRSDAGQIMQAFDYFIFPSIFEGLGMAVVEAQASGLRCLASDMIPKETSLSTLIQYMSLEDGVKSWADKIEKEDCVDRIELSKEACLSIERKGYSICTEASKLKEIYCHN